LIRDKPFGTANTQTALALMLAFLVRNGAMVDAPDEELAGVCIGVAQGEVYAGMVTAEPIVGLPQRLPTPYRNTSGSTSLISMANSG
jgi:hypothetical protein